EGRDGLSLHLVPLVHRPVEEARGIEDLVAVYAAVKVAERHPFRREGVVRHLRTAARGRAHERALADVRVARDHDRRNRRVNLWDSPQSDSSVDQGVDSIVGPAPRTRATARFRARVARSGPVAVALAARPNALSRRESAVRIEGNSNTAARITQPG